MSKSINQQEILAVASFFEEAMFPWHLKLNHIEDLLLLLNCIMESSLLFNMMIETKQNNEQQIHGKCLLLLHGTSGKQKNSFIFENKQLNLPSWKCQFLEYATLQAHRFKKKKLLLYSFCTLNWIVLLTLSVVISISLSLLGLLWP